MSFLRRGAGGTRDFIVNLGNNIDIQVGDVTTSPFSANAAIRFNTNGTFQAIRSDSTGILTQPSTIFSVSVPNLVANTNFYVRANLVSNTATGTPVGTLDTWLQTSAARTWYVSVGSDDNQSGTLRIEVSKVSGGPPVDGFLVTLDATGGGIA